MLNIKDIDPVREFNVGNNLILILIVPLLMPCIVIPVLDPQYNWIIMVIFTFFFVIYALFFFIHLKLYFLKHRRYLIRYSSYNPYYLVSTFWLADLLYPKILIGESLSNRWVFGPDEQEPVPNI